MDERTRGGTGAEGGPPKSWREQLKDIRNAAVRRYTQGASYEEGKSPQEIRGIRDKELQDQMDRLDNYSDGTEADPAAHEATTFQKAALELVESARQHVIEPVKGTVIPVIPKITYAVLTAALAEEGIPPKKAMALAKVANMIVGRRLQGKAKDALGGLEHALNAIEDHVLRAQIKAELDRKIEEERAREAADGGSAAGPGAAGGTGGADDEAAGTGPEASGGGAGDGSSGGRGGGPEGPEDPGGPEDAEDEDEPEIDPDTVEETARRLGLNPEVDLTEIRQSIMEMNGGMADQEKQFLLRVSRMKFTEKYKEEVTESEVSLMKAAGFENPDPAQIREAVQRRLASERYEDFIINGLQKLDRETANAKTEVEKTQRLMEFLAYLETIEYKYNPQEFNRLIQSVESARFSNYARRRNADDIETIIKNMKYEANIFLPPDQEAFMRKLSSASTALTHLAELEGEELLKDPTNPQSARDRAWDIFTTQINNLTDRILSSRVVRHDETFSLTYQENSVIRGIQGRLRMLGTQITERLQTGEPFTHTYIDPENPARTIDITYDSDSKVSIEDIDRTYGLSRDSRSLGTAVEDYLAPQVYDQKDRVEIVHNIMHSISQGVGLEDSKRFTAKLPSEFVDRLLLSNPEYSLAEQEYLKELDEAIERNGGFIPDDFGIKNRQGLDAIEENVFNNLLSLIRKKEHETDQEHKNRCLQALRAGEVIAYAYTGDAFSRLKYAKPKPDFVVGDNGEVTQVPRGEQTHSRTYWAFAPKIMPFFFHHMYGAPPHKPWIKSVYIPHNLDSYVTQGGAARENFSYEQVLDWDRVLTSAQSFGASEELRRDFYPHFRTLMDIEDQGYLGATQAGKMGKFDQYVEKKADIEGRSVDDVVKTVANLRRLGSGYVHTYISTKIDWFANPANYSSLDTRTPGREHSLLDLQRAYNEAEEAYKKSKQLAARRGRMSKTARKALVDFNEAKRALTIRITELEVLIPLRDTLPSSMLSAEKVPFTPDLEVDQQMTVRQQMSAAVSSNADVQTFLRRYSDKPLAKQYVDSEVTKIALSTQSMVETLLLKARRDRYDALWKAGQKDAARALLEPSQSVFKANEAYDSEVVKRALNTIYSQIRAVSKTQDNFSLGTIFPDQESFQQFMREYSCKLQLAIGDLHPSALDDINDHTHSETVRYQFYGSEDERSVSDFLKEKRKLTALEKKASGQERASLRAQIDALNVRLSQWISRNQASLQRDSITRRTAEQIFDKRGPIATEMFNRDKSMDKANLTRLGSNFAEKQINNGITEQTMIAASTPLWLSAIDSFVLKARSGEEGLKGAVGDLSGPLKAIAKELDQKDPVTAPARTAQRILMLERFLLETPAARVQLLGIKAQEWALRSKIPINLMGTAFQDSAEPDMEVYTMDRDDAKFLTQKLVASVQEVVRIPPHRMRYLGRTEVIDGGNVRGTRIAAGASRIINTPTQLAERASQKLHGLGMRLENTRLGGMFGRGIGKIGTFLERVAMNLPARTAQLDSRISSFMQRFNSAGRKKIIPQYEDQGVSLDLLRQVQGSYAFDPARWNEDWPMWLMSSLAALTVFTIFLFKPAMNNKGK